MTAHEPRLSLVIPVGPDETELNSLLRQLVQLQAAVPALRDAERVISYRASVTLPASLQAQLDIRLVDATSVNDSTLSASFGPRSVNARAQQLNAGAQAATGDFLWFIHADSQLSVNVVQQAIHFMHSPHAQRLAYFKLSFANDGPFFTKLNAWGANWRSRAFKLPFGDQAFLVSRATWEKIGAYEQSVQVGEDLDWVVRAKDVGVKLICLPATVKTSARKYARLGWLNTSLMHLVATVQLVRAARQRIRNSARALSADVRET
ncbi:MAG TPA: glycosyltransferase [Pseudomonadales bacterium]|nr:glycosyltransferase [Pseudomonadales bacterium]